jgi:hypothetical protein
MTFISVDFGATDASSLAGDALLRLQDRWDGWEPNDGDLEVVQIETIAPMVADAIAVASEVPDAIFRAYGTQLIGEPYQVGVAATGSATFTALDSTGYDSVDAVQIAVGGQSFITDGPVVVPAGETSVTQPVTALVEGVAANDLGGLATPISAVSWVDTITVSTTSGGVDPEDDDAYQDRLNDFLKLQSTTLVTARDFELMAMNDPRIGRAKATFDNARKVIVTITDPNGEAITDAAVKTDLAALFGDYRQVNTLYSIVDPLYTTIDVVYKVVALPDYEPADVSTRAHDAVVSWLSPANWGVPASLGTAEDSQGSWLDSETVVRYSELLRVLSVDGVRYVDTTVTRLNGGTADITLTSSPTQPHPLTRPGTIAAAP